MGWSREEMAQRAAQEISPGMVVNLGIGIPTLMANYLEGRGAWIHSENGLLGMGPFPYQGEEDPQLINAGKQTVTVLAGGSTFDSNLSFAMIRGGHVDVAVLGAMEVAANGDIANWQIPGKKITGMGGAMDLVSGAKKVFCLLSHTDKKGRPKLLERCRLPLTGQGCVHRVITDMGYFEVMAKQGPNGAFRILELAPQVSRDQLASCTGAPLWD